MKNRPRSMCSCKSHFTLFFNDTHPRMSLCLESDLVPVMPPDSGGWSADPSAQQTFLCPLLLVGAFNCTYSIVIDLFIICYMIS
jgi:hypothetical protein